MKKILVAVLVAGLMSIAGASLAGAQSSPAALVKVPFQFIVNGKVLPAGTYRITSQEGAPSLLMVTGTDRKAPAAFVETESAGDTDAGAPVHVAFKNVDGQFFLSKITMPSGEIKQIPINKVEAERVLVRLNLMPAEHGDTAK